MNIVSFDAGLVTVTGVDFLHSKVFEDLTRQVNKAEMDAKSMDISDFSGIVPQEDNNSDESSSNNCC